MVRCRHFIPHIGGVLTLQHSYRGAGVLCTRAELFLQHVQPAAHGGRIQACACPSRGGLALRQSDGTSHPMQYTHQPHCAALQITNVCVSLNEFPYIRYYMPSTHLPLGPLKPVAQNRPPPPPEGSSRWRTNLARGSEARAYESVETDFVTKLLAFMVQSNLEEYKNANTDFGVCISNPDAAYFLLP